VVPYQPFDRNPLHQLQIVLVLMIILEIVRGMTGNC